MSHSADDHDHDHAHAGGHNHGLGGGHVHAPANFDRAFAVGVVLNLGFVGVEAGYGLISNSLALLADAGHNLSDVAGLLLAWGASWLARRAPTSARTYGYGRTSILAALANAILLLAAIGVIGWEAIQRFGAPQPVQTGPVIIVAAIGIVINTATALMFLRGGKDDINIRGAFLHMAADAGVSAGVVIGGVVMGLTGWLWLDPALSLAIVALIFFGTWSLLRDSTAMAIDSVPSSIDLAAVLSSLRGFEGISDVHDLHIWPLSTTSIALTAHLVRDTDRIDDDLTARIVQELKERFKIDHATLQFETGGHCALRPDHVV